MAQVIIIVFTLIFFLFGVVFLVYTNTQVKNMKASMTEIDEEIKQLNADLSALNKDAENEDTVEEVHVKLNSALDVGRDVASLQTKYNTLNVLDNEAEMKDVAKSIGLYMEDKSNQVPWYPVKSDEIAYSWVFHTTYSFSDTTVPVLWTCRSNNGDLLAYATGTYEVEDNMFSDLEYHITSMGMSHVKTSDDDNYDSVSSNSVSANELVNMAINGPTDEADNTEPEE